MKWLNLDKYCEKSGEYFIATYFSHSKVKFGLSVGNKNLGYFDSKEDAKKEAWAVYNGKV